MMLPSDGIHGFSSVQVAVVVYLALAVGITIGLWLLGLPSEMGMTAFVAVAAVLLVPFWPLFRRHHPKHHED